MAQLHLAVLVFVANPQTARLCVAQVGAGANLEILLLTGAPSLDIAALHLQVSQVAGAALQLTDGDFHVAEQLHAVLPQLFVPILGFLGLADHDHFLLFELVNPVHTALLDAVGALLLAEAGGVRSQRLGQALFRQNLVNETADHGVLGSTDQIQILAFDFVHHGVHIGLAHHALYHVAVNHKGRNAVGKALADHKVTAISQNSLMQAGNITQQIVETVAGYPTGCVQINAVEGFHNLGVVGNGVLGHNGVAETLHFHVAAVVRSQRYALVDNLGNHQHNLVNLCLQLALFCLQLSQTVSVFLHFFLHSLSLSQLAGVFFGLTHEHTDLLGQGIARGTQLLCLLNGSAQLLVQSNDLVYQRQLFILKLLFDVFFYQFRIFPDQFHVQHVCFSLHLKVIKS